MLLLIAKVCVCVCAHRHTHVYVCMSHPSLKVCLDLVLTGWLSLIFSLNLKQWALGGGYSVVLVCWPPWSPLNARSMRTCALGGRKEMVFIWGFHLRFPLSMGFCIHAAKPYKVHYSVFTSWSVSVRKQDLSPINSGLALVCVSFFRVALKGLFAVVMPFLQKRQAGGIVLLHPFILTKALWDVGHTEGALHSRIVIQNSKVTALTTAPLLSFNS